MRHANGRCGEGRLEGSKSVALRVSLVLNTVLVLVVAACGVYKFTDIRTVLGGGASHDENTWFEPFVSQARDLSLVEESDVVMLGDSLTMYGLWGELFPDARILNRGIGSDVSEGVLNRLDTVTSTNPDKVFIMIGTNDIARGHDVNPIAGNVEEVISRLVDDLPEAEIYLESVLPRTSKYSEQIQELNKAYRQICDRREGVGFVDLHPLFCDADGVPDTELFASDGYHISGVGYRVWAKANGGYIE
ncbi:GDSL-type esterase/lipase family protein [Arabiibacter massiliensis]|uniref:GDSL-type esterase/lipase family protein n=1 Tax=Arabiibacter massiliensis TaxID=1870985 RepID=UPI0009B9D555|nr:GDSL-type esterase/lipase family protein [Arabiibacter massiliensis]